MIFQHPRECVIAVVGRVSIEQAHDAAVLQDQRARAVREDDLTQRLFEREIYRDLAAQSRRAGLIDVKAERMATEPAQPTERCIWCHPAGCVWPRCTQAEMAVTAGGPPTVPTRRNRRRQSNLQRSLHSLWRWLLSPRAGFGPL